MKRKRGLSVRLIAGLLFAVFACGAHADIYQWHDGDGDGSLWLSDSKAQPHSNISRQVLWWANLENANLDSANLSASNLSYANLNHANLENADLAFTLFVGADLQVTNIDNANLFYADVSYANLTGMQNWESAFWLAARYNENTLFPIGMNPDSFGMINLSVPNSGALAVFGISVVFTIRRRL
jgi:hypothetical protein